MIYKETQYGFKWGPIEVIRLAHSERDGWAIVGIKTEKTSAEIYVTKSGKIRYVMRKG